MPADNSATESGLVSVICRTMGRSVLKEALASLQNQDYRHLELVLVDAAAAGIRVDDLHLDSELPGLTLVNTGQPLARAAAANAGLDAATGDLLMFLDEDDWIDPGHISGLVNCLQQHPDVKAAYSSTRKTNSHGEPLDHVFNEPFQRLLLLRDNYIPIHAMLFSRQLLELGCRFDEQFDVYEDWDFWLQLAQHTDFLHRDEVTAFYREGGDSETDADDVSQRYASGHPLAEARARLFDKWLPHLNGQTLNALIGDMDRSAELTELAATVQREHEANLQHQEQIRELLAELEQSHHRLNEAQQQQEELRAAHAHELEKLHAVDQQRLNSIAQLQEELAARQAQVADLENALHAIYESTSWKITRPVRGIARLLRRNSSGED